MKKLQKIKKIRKPLPRQRSHAHTTKKGKKGYNRRRDKKDQEVLYTFYEYFRKKDRNMTKEEQELWCKMNNEISEIIEI